MIGNPGEGFFGAPFDKPTRSYRALELSLQKAFSNRWHLNSSFVYAKANGNHEGLYMSGYDQLDPNITALYDIPSFLPNSDGRLRADKPYQFKLFTRLLVRLWADVVRRHADVRRRADLGARTRDRQRLRGRHDLPAAARIAGAHADYWNFDFHADYRLPLGSARNLQPQLFSTCSTCSTATRCWKWIRTTSTRAWPGSAAWECRPTSMRSAIRSSTQPAVEHVLQDTDPVPEPALGADWVEVHVLRTLRGRTALRQDAERSAFSRGQKAGRQNRPAFLFPGREFPRRGAPPNCCESAPAAASR